MSSFFKEFNSSFAKELSLLSFNASSADVERIIAQGCAKSIEDFAILLSPMALEYLEELAQISHFITTKYFGKTINLFAPLYVSNNCVNNCKYCGFAMRHDFERRTLNDAEILEECLALHDLGFRNCLLVSSEHPKLTGTTYLSKAVAIAHKIFPSVSVEIAPSSVEDYSLYVENGCEGLTVFQETYDKNIYPELHPSGPKSDFEWRLGAAERGAKAGMRKIGLGPLLGLNDWRFEILSCALHAKFLYKHAWKSKIGISLPRMRPYAGSFEIKENALPSDKEITQIICALRMLFNYITITISTRENPKLRAGLIAIGATQMSAESSTKPGGYAHPTKSGEQFEIDDKRSAKEFSLLIKSLGYDTVWKDFDSTLSGSL